MLENFPEAVMCSWSWNLKEKLVVTGKVMGEGAAGQLVWRLCDRRVKRVSGWVEPACWG